MSRLLNVESLKKHYPQRTLFRTTGYVRAVDGISFSLAPRETLAIVGESGCGKSTLAKLLTQVEEPTSGSISYNGTDLGTLDRRESLSIMQMIFQDPLGSLNPRKRAWQIIGEPLMINTSMDNAKIKQRAQEVMELVGIRPELADRFPHMFSGGQRQRIGIARALVLKPKILICDEPVSALDVSVQAQILNLLCELQEELDLSLVFISHDLSVVRHIADKVMVIYLGKTVEYGSCEEVFQNPQHPYTKALLDSTLEMNTTGVSQELRAISGELPSPMNPPSGCAYHLRCPLAEQRCSQRTPPLEAVEGSQVACHILGSSGGPN